jgi:D-alanyl-D-alanine carboxypeptidase (penicillin-binding protein 5/6)
MNFVGRRASAAIAFAVAISLALGAGWSAPVSSAQAQGLFSQPKYAAIVIDANSGEVLYAKRADALRYAASISKVLTLYLTFEALATGRLSLDDRLVISPHAFSMMPSKVSSHPGETLTVAQAIPALTVHSANDVAVALAEKIAGSEPRFAQLMNLRARELGMTNSQFINASGVPERRHISPDQNISTARDIAILCRAIMRDYPQYYAYFGEKSFYYNGKLLINHNHLVAKMPGVDGLKTGFTNAAGFNLAASAVRDGRRLITVVLGGSSGAARDENVEELLNAGFNVLNRRAKGDHITLASVISEPDDESGPLQRAPVEQGSADQPDLKVVVQPQVRTLPVLATAGALNSKPAEPSDLTPRASELAKVEPTPAPSKAAAKADAVAEAKPAPCPTRRHRHAKACVEAEPAGRVDVAKAELRPRAPTPLKVAEKAPEKAQEKASDHKGEKLAEKGGFMIQVGAYKNPTQAKDHLHKVADDFGRVVGSALAEVEKAGGNYRARFRGLNEKQAKAACQALSAKGQQCMVMDAS